MITTGQIPERHVVEEAALVMVKRMTMARVRRRCRAVRKGQGKSREQRMEWGKGKGR